MLVHHQRNEYALFLLLELVLIFDDEAFLFSPVRFLYPETPFLLTNLAAATKKSKKENGCRGDRFVREKINRVSAL